MVGCFEHGDEFLDSVQSGEFLDQLRDCVGYTADIRAGFVLWGLCGTTLS